MELTFLPSRLSRAAHVTVLSALCLLTADATAIDWHNGDWQVHGFLSQGFTYTTHNNVFGSSHDGSFDFTELGINGSVRLMPNLLMSAQGLYRSAGGSDTQGFRLDFGQADYSVPLLEQAATVGVRAGRVKIPFGLYNSTRDVIWTRPSVLLPQSVYFDTLALRQPMLAADGGVLYGRYTYGDHNLNLEFLVAEPQDNVGGAQAFLTGLPNPQGSLTGRPLLLGRAAYEWFGGRGRLMFSVVDLDRDFDSKSFTTPSGNVTALYPLFSGQYNAERWSLTAEYGWIEAERNGFIPIAQKITHESFYVQGEYRLTETWSAVLRYDVFFVDRNDRSGKDLSELTGLPRHRFYAKDLTAGVRWEFARNWLIAAEYHHVNGTAWLSTEDNPDLQTGGGTADWDLFATMLSFRF
jgi:hypothetical protein